MDSHDSGEQVHNAGHLETLAIYEEFRRMHPEIAALLDDNRTMISYALRFTDPNLRKTKIIIPTTAFKTRFDAWIRNVKNKRVFDALPVVDKHLIIYLCYDGSLPEGADGSEFLRSFSNTLGNDLKLLTGTSGAKSGLWKVIGELITLGYISGGIQNILTRKGSDRIEEIMADANN